MPSQLWKIPLLLTSARLYQQATTPPNKPAAASEKLKYGSTTPDFMSSGTARRIAKSTVVSTPARKRPDSQFANLYGITTSFLCGFTHLLSQL